MPELPEVETVRRGLSRHLIERRIVDAKVNREGLRFPFPENMAKRLTGRQVLSIERRAKYLLAHLDDGWSWLIHLGMSGRWTLTNGDSVEPEIHDHVVVTLDDGGVAVYNDPRRFGIMDLVESDLVDEHKLLASLGPEPLSDNFTSASLCAALAGRQTPIKSALLDQRVVSGLGNIYVCELLHRAKVSPRRSSHTVAGTGGRVGIRAERIVEQTKVVLQEAIESGGSTLRDFQAVDGELGYFSHQFQVYGREGEPCLRQGCGGVVSRISQSGRSTFFCSGCQR